MRLVEAALFGGSCMLLSDRLNDRGVEQFLDVLKSFQNIVFFCFLRSAAGSILFELSALQRRAIHCADRRFLRRLRPVDLPSRLLNEMQFGCSSNQMSVRANKVAL